MKGAEIKIFSLADNRINSASSVCNERIKLSQPVVGGEERRLLNTIREQ